MSPVETKIFNYKPTPPYDFSTHLEGFSLPGKPVPWIFDRKTRSMRMLLCREPENCVPVEVSFIGEPWDPYIEIIAIGHASHWVMDNVLEIVRARFDWRVFERRARKISFLNKVVSMFPGVRPGRCLSLYNALVDVVVKQRIALKLAIDIYSRLVRAYGMETIIDGREYYSHPMPTKLAAADPADVRGLGLTRVKARSIVEISKAEVEGRLPSIKEALEEPENTAKELTKIYGVGEWSAKLALAMVNPLFPLGPSSDLAVRRGIQMLTGKEPSPQVVEEFLEELGDYTGLAMYLAALYYEKSKTRKV